MTVSTEVSREEYTGNGVTTDFDYRFRVFRAADLVVTVANTSEVITTLALNTDYTVTGAGSRNGGKVKLFTPLAFNWRISIERSLPATQETDVRNQGNFFPEVHEDAWDKLTMLVQQIRSVLGLALRKPSWLARYYDALGNRIANLGNPVNPQDAAPKSYVDSAAAGSTEHADNLFQRTLRVPESSVNQLPSVAARANSLLGWNDQGQPIPVFAMTDTADLAIRLASHTHGNGGSLVGLVQGGTVQDAITYLTPEMSGAIGDGIADDSDAINQALQSAYLNGFKGVFLGSKYKISKMLTIPSGVHLFGAGDETGIFMDTPPTIDLFRLISIPGNNSQLRNFSIEFNASGYGNISLVMYGIFFEGTSRFCSVSNMKVFGRYNNSGMGFSNGIRVTGEYNSVRESRVEYCTMGCTVRGAHHAVDTSYFNNHYYTIGARPWSVNSPHWDGIAVEGGTYCTITQNTVEDNGQSGIYIGGGNENSLSYGNLIAYNTVTRNYNRGVDCGISGTISETRDVRYNRIIGNHIKNNHEAQLWLFGVSFTTVIGNVVEVTPEYDSLFPEGKGGSLAGISLGYTTACINNVIQNNIVKVTTTASFAVVMNGTGHIYSGNNVSGQISYLWPNDNYRLVANTIDYYANNLLPIVASGTGITVSSSSGWYSISGAELSFSMSLTLSASSPSGTLLIGYIPGVASATAKISNIQVASYNGWSTSMEGVLKAQQDTSLKDQVVIYRDFQGNKHFDVADLVRTGATITITGAIEVLK